MENKRVSIVLCTYQGGKYLREQLDSIIAQTYPLYEIIIQDDGSTDDTMDILNAYAERFPYIHVFSNEKEHGINGNFLSAIRRARGEYIAISDQDDRWEADKIERQMEAIGSHLLCSGHSRPFSEDGSFAWYDNRRPNTSLIRMMFLCLPGHTLLFHRDLFFKKMPIESEMYKVSVYDAALCITAAAYNSIVYVDEVLVNFRRHEQAATYNDFSRSLPSWKNGLYIISWSLRNYRKARKVAKRIFHSKLDLLEKISSEEEIYKEAISILQLEQKDDFISFVKLQWHFIRNHHRLFQTYGGGGKKILRAALYPIMQLYMYHQAVR